MSKKLINTYGDICYYNDNDQYHRIDGPAVEHDNGFKVWYLNGKHHRVDGPAIELPNGNKAWLLNGQLHRVDGPAIEQANGNKRWYYEDKKVNCSSQEQFEKLIKLRLYW